ncbi:hypothetical protein IAE55_27065 [Paenibacillus sp. S28]|nr:hypothetical protein [Paenibacillus sp. S28]
MLVPVPAAEVDVALPANMTFFVDNRFTSTQRGRIRTLISRCLEFWRLHYEQIAENGRSNYQNCVNTYARFNLAPVWFDAKLATGSAAAAVQMDGLTRMIVANGFGRAARAQIMYQLPSSTVPNFTIKAVNASNPDVSPLSVTVNPRAISRTDLLNVTLTGSLFHAWLHREGYRHPSRVYTSYMAGEASMCVMRNNANKTPGVPDSRFTVFLD